MKPPVNNRVAIVGGAQASASFGISVGNEAHIMGILRDTLYSDKVLAVLREYASNAWDAHRVVGKHELPIEVTLPTGDEPTLRIRDHGPGLSRSDVFTIYTQYGASTKRDSDDAVGMLGIGSKSGFAYSDSFTITSWHGGLRSTYVAALDESEKGVINLLAEESCDAADTGVEIQIAVRSSDIYEFERTARKLFRHFTPRPEINIELPALPEERTVLTNGIITPGSDAGWIAVMGCVPYRLNLGALDAREIPKCLPHLSGTLTFGIGEVNVNASREELKYSAQTKAALIVKLTALVDEYVTHALKELDAGTLDGWQTRLRCQVLAQMDLPLPEKWKGLAEGFAKVTYTHDDFTILHNKAACTRLLVSDDTCLLIDDTGYALDGYAFGHDDYVIRCATKTAEQLRTKLDAVLATSGLTGITIELLSARHWTAPVQPKKRMHTPKHRARMFKFEPVGRKYVAPWSDYWGVELRVPTKDDVFVVIRGFKAEGYEDFYKDYKADEDLAEAFGATLPTIYAYKSTEKKPVLASSCEGTFYRDWRKTLIDALMTPERIELIASLWASNPTGDHYSNSLPDKQRVTWLAKHLGDSHPTVELLTNATAAFKLIASARAALIQLAGRSGHTYEKSTAKAAFATMTKRYPLLRRVGFRELWGSYYDNDADVRSDWVDYVKLCDEREAARAVGDNVVQLRERAVMPHLFNLSDTDPECAICGKPRSQIDREDADEASIQQRQREEQNAMPIPFTLTNENITIILDGKPVVVHAGSPQFHGLRDALFREDWLAVPQYASAAGALQQWLGDKFVVVEKTISYEGVPLPTSLNARVWIMISAGESPGPLFRFYERLHKNPSFRSRTQLFSFLQHTGIPLEPDGTFLAYKGVKHDYTDAHTGKVDNSPGVTNTMARNLISDDPNVPCHFGYHVGALGYAGDFSQRTVVCRIDPEHVVCVPNDFNAQKMRVCEYTVIGNHDGVTEMPSTTYAPDVDEGDDSEEWSGDVEHENQDEPEHYQTGADSCACGELWPCAEAPPVEQAGRPYKVVLTTKKPKPTKPKAASFNRMAPGKLMEQSIDDLRKYAAAHLKIIGASKMPGGKSALVSKILKVRRRRRS